MPRTKNASYVGETSQGQREVGVPDSSNDSESLVNDSEQTLSGSSHSTDSNEEVTLERRLEMYFPPSQYTKPFKISAKCSIKETVKLLEDHLTEDEMSWFRNHPQFKHFFHMPKSANHKLMGMWMLFLRTAKIAKTKECWFIVNGVPIRYSLREMALMSGLYCHNYPANKDTFGGTAFVGAQFGVGATITREEVKKKLFSMKKPFQNRLKMAVLYFLCSVLIGKRKGGKQAPSIHPFFIRAVKDLEGCLSYPWGREAFEQNIKDIFHCMDHYGGDVRGQWVFPCFIIPLEYLEFEAIHALKNSCIEVVPAHKSCPRMCKMKFKSGEMKGFAFKDINVQLGTTKDIQSILTLTSRERRMLHQIMDIDNGWNDNDDALTDGWTRLILVEKKMVWSRHLYIEDVKVRGLDLDVGDEDDAVGFSGVIRDETIPEDAPETIPAVAPTMPADAPTMPADAPYQWRNEMVALKGKIEIFFPELNMKIEGLGTRVSSIESSLRLEREEDEYNRGFDDYNPRFEEEQPAAEQVQPRATEVQPDATIVQPAAEQVQLGETEVQPDATMVQPVAEQVQIGATKVQPDATMVHPAAEQVQPAATEVQPRLYERRKRKRAAEVPAEASSEVPAEVTHKIKYIAKEKGKGSTVVIRSPIGTRQRDKILERQKKD